MSSSRAPILFLSALLALGQLSACSDDSPPSPQDGAVADGEVAPDGGGQGEGGVEADGPVQGCGGGCKTPPKTRCVDGDTLRVYESEGFCENDTCHYGFKDETCADGCDQSKGQCKGSPCQGVTCDQPPASECADPNTLKTYQSPGTCDAQGQCIYKDSLVPCQNGCENGQCKGDPCAGVTCNTPPKKSCESPTTLRTYDPQGSCTAGQCSYTHKDVTCPFGCELGACKGDPCAGVSCATPPASFCQGANTLRSFITPGSCAGGSCTYTHKDTTCPYGCAQGACKGDPCAGVSCASPPASYCPDANTLRSFASPGTCAGGSCTYTHSDTPCAFGCQNGACQGDPCVGKTCTTPPATHCKDANTQRSYATIGTCQNGACSYTPTDTPCAHGCALGTCVADPCSGVSCSAPPANSCVNGSTLRVYASSGICSGGACSYPYTDQPCPGGCSGGVCNGPSCGGKVCNTPPAPSCDSASLAQTYAPIGTCDNGSCAYQTIYIRCSEGCFNGACIAGSQETEYIPTLSNMSFVAMALDGTGGSHFLGCSGNPYGLVYRHKTLSGWVDEQIETGTGFCSGTLAVDSSGAVHMSYYDSTNDDLRYARWQNGVLQKQLVATAGDMGYDSAITFDGAGKPVIAYYGESGGHHVYVATRGTSSWTSTLIHTQTSKISGNLEIQRDSGGDYHVLFGFGQSIYMRGKGSTWAAQTLPTGSKAGRALAFLPSGELRYAYSYSQKVYIRSMSAAGGALGDDEYIGKATTYYPVAFLDRYWPASLVTGNFAEYYKTDLGLWDRAYRFNVVQNSKFYDARVGADKRARVAMRVGYGPTWGVLTEPVCTPKCGPGSCGSDGCGGSCGTCGSGQSCSPSKTCTGWKFERIGETGTTTSNTTFEFIGSDVHIFDDKHHYHYSNGSWTVITPPFSDEVFDTFVDSQGKLHAAWYNYQNYYGGPLQVATFTNGAWSTPQAVGESGHAGVALYVDSAGKYHIFAGRRQPTYNYSTRHITFDASTSTATVAIVHTSTSAARLQVARDSGGKWHLFWFNYTALLYSTDASGSWVHSTVDSDASSYSPHDYRLMQDAAGGLHLCYWDNTKHKPIYAKKNGATWDKEDLPGTTGAYCAMDSAGKVIAADRTKLYTRTGVNTWTSEAIPVMEPGSTTQSWAHHRPAVAFDPSSRSHLFYIFNVDGHYHAYHAVR